MRLIVAEWVWLYKYLALILIYNGRGSYLRNGYILLSRTYSHANAVI